MSEKINILVIPSDAHGVGKFRATGPYTHLQENFGDDFHVDIKFDVEKTNEAFEKYDIIVAHSFIHKSNGNKEKPDQNPISDELRRINWLKSQGKIVIIDIDDFWLPNSSHPMYIQIMKSGQHKRKIELLKAASYVSTTTSVYRDTIIEKLGLKNVVVFPNAIDENEKQYISNPTPSDKIRFGWLGGSSHLPDIKLLRNGISIIQDNFKGKVQFVLCGFDTRGSVSEYNKDTDKVTKRHIKPEETVWYEYEKIFTKNYQILDGQYLKHLSQYKDLQYPDTDKPYVRKWTRDISKYALNYNSFDVSLAPLDDNHFNWNKSQLKAIESGFHKKAIIASECNPYTIDLVHSKNALLVAPRKNHKQWQQYMSVLMKNPNLIKDLGNELYETVKDTYSLRVVNKDRSEFLKSIIK